MQLTFVRNICAAFVVVTVALLLACLFAMHAVQGVAARLDESVTQMRGEADVSGQLAALEFAMNDLQRSQVLILALGLAGLCLGLVLLVMATSQATRILTRLRRATQQLANVVLDEELPESASTSTDDLEREIQEMMRKIKLNQQLCLDASPLTRLPGNIAIEQVLKGKMARNEKFALCYIDLDDFKAYNDKYGYAKGSDLIKLTGEIIYRAKDRFAHAEDFVGHIGGDDFVLVTDPGMAEDVCKAIIEEFDQVIPGFYDDVDQARGYIKGLDRYGVERQFPLMSISIAVVSDARRDFNSPIEIAKVATEIKDYVKTLPGSNFLIDRRRNTRRDT